MSKTQTQRTRPAPTPDGIDNRGEADYEQKIAQIAQALTDWDGPVVLIGHVDPDGDALGSTLALKRALDKVGKETHLPMEVPSFLSFLVQEGEVSPTLETLPENSLLAVLDVEVGKRATGAPLDAAFTVNIDHHGSNPRTGDLSCVQPSKAATAQMVKDLIDALDVSWTPEIATSCLVGLLTDTGNFRYSNTDKSVLVAAGELIEHGADYTRLTDRLQWRDPGYFAMLGKVMSTVDFAFGGLAVTAYMTLAMEKELGATESDSNDYVGLIRYAEGSKVAAFLKERDGHTKLSVRTRDGVSAQRICHALGGGGHVNAAGAKLEGSLERARNQLLAATEHELKTQGLL